MGDTVYEDAIELAAGPLAMIFEPANAMLRYVRFGDVELVRGVFAAVRDQDWNTVRFSVHDFQSWQTADEFELTFLVKCSDAGIAFDWRGMVSGSSAGVVRFDFRGESKSSFLKNRIGLCVLHPIKECVDRRCVIGHPDGTSSEGAFPKWISPDQPFKNVRSMTHDVSNQHQAKVTFEGEVFETEDQRNWTDASFKTYCTPLEQPFPVEIQAGSKVEQSVTIELLGDLSSTSRGNPASTRVDVECAESDGNITVDWEHPRPLVPVGLSMATCGEHVSSNALERLRDVKPAHLRVDLRLDRNDWDSDLREAISLASQVDTKLEIATFKEDVDHAVWTRCLAELSGVRDRIARWLVFHSTAKSTTDELVQAATSSLQAFSPELPIVVGTDAYFAELNRNRPIVPEGCFVCYSINPQVHAFDNLSLCETLEAHHWTVGSARQLFNRAVVISPITLRPRFNPNATSISDVRTVAESDLRQASEFVAAWTVGVLAQLASQPGVASLTFYETVGPRGIMSPTGETYPVAAVFKAICDIRFVYQSTSNSPRDLAVLGMQRACGTCELLLANMSKQPKTVSVNGLDGRASRYSLDAESVELVQWESQHA